MQKGFDSLAARDAANANDEAAMFSIKAKFDAQMMKAYATDLKKTQDNIDAKVHRKTSFEACRCAFADRSGLRGAY